jgi:hypothetical protein
MLSWSTAGGRRRAVGGSVIIIHCLFKTMNQRSIVHSVESWEYFFTYVNYYHALTLKKYARIFDSRDFWHTFSCCPTLFHSFTLYDFHKGKVGIEKKYAELAYFLAIFGNSGVQKGMALLLQEKVCQFTCYRHTMICVIR